MFFCLRLHLHLEYEWKRNSWCKIIEFRRIKRQSYTNGKKCVRKMYLIEKHCIFIWNTNENDSKSRYLHVKGRNFKFDITPCTSNWRKKKSNRRTCSENFNWTSLPGLALMRTSEWVSEWVSESEWHTHRERERETERLAQLYFLGQKNESSKEEEI